MAQHFNSESPHRFEKVVGHVPWLVTIRQPNGQCFTTRVSALNRADAVYWVGLKYGHTNVVKIDGPLH